MVSSYEEIVRVAEFPHQWDKLNNSTVLISGGTGFIGSFLIDVFRFRNEKYHSNIKIISVSRRGGGCDSYVENIQADITNTLNIADSIDYIIHLASNTHPKQYSEDPVGTITTNVLGCNNLLKLAVEKKVKRFLLSSSVEIYGQCDSSFMDESYCGYIDCTDVRSGYNEAKRTCESLCQAYIKQYGVDCVVARFARVFGVDKKKDTKAMAQFIQMAIEGNPIILKSKGTQRFSYCYCPDAVNGLLSVLLEGETGNSYNIAAENDNYSLADYARYIAEISGTNVLFEIDELPGVSKAKNALIKTDKIKHIGWFPLYTVKEGIYRTISIIKEKE